jgi:hypothetical protein
MHSLAAAVREVCTLLLPVKAIYSLAAAQPELRTLMVPVQAIRILMVPVKQYAS